MAFTKNRFQLVGNWDEVRAKLQEVQTSDNKAEGEMKRGYVGVAWGLGILVLGILCLVFVPPLSGILMFAGGAVIILGLIYRTMNASYDLENQRYEIPLQLLETICVDLDPSKEISLTVDFRASQTSQFVTKVEQSKFLIFSSGPKVTYFSHPWLTLAAITALGYKLQVDVTREGTYKEVPKRKRTKTKLRFYDVVTVAVRPPRGSSLSIDRTGTPLAAPLNHRFRTFRGQVTSRGAIAKVAGPVSWVVRNRSTSSGGQQLASHDLLTLIMSAFRGVVKTSKA